MKEIKVKESCDRYGFKRLVFKESFKEVLYIYFPNQFKTGFGSPAVAGVAIL